MSFSLFSCLGVSLVSMSFRVTIVYLTCDPNADTPIITADGDGATPLTYVS